jgi:hypothetical protein
MPAAFPKSGAAVRRLAAEAGLKSHLEETNKQVV